MPFSLYKKGENMTETMIDCVQCSLEYDKFVRIKEVLHGNHRRICGGKPIRVDDPLYVWVNQPYTCTCIFFCSEKCARKFEGLAVALRRSLIPESTLVTTQIERNIAQIGVATCQREHSSLA